MQDKDGTILELVSQDTLKKQLESLEKLCITTWQNEQKIMHLFGQLTFAEPLLDQLAPHLISNGTSFLTSYQAFFKAQLRDTKSNITLDLNDALRFLNLRNLLVFRSSKYVSNINLIMSNAEFLWGNNNNRQQKTQSKEYSWITEHEKRFNQCLPLVEKIKDSFKSHKEQGLNQQNLNQNISTDQINFPGIINTLKNQYEMFFPTLVKPDLIGNLQ